MHPDPYLTRPRIGPRPVDQGQDARVTGQGILDGTHMTTLSLVASGSSPPAMPPLVDDANREDARDGGGVVVPTASLRR